MNTNGARDSIILDLGGFKASIESRSTVTLDHANDWGYVYIPTGGDKIHFVSVNLYSGEEHCCGQLIFPTN